jgi:hypothetical protein
MGGLILVLVVFLGISYLIASKVYNKQTKAGKNPWVWSIFSFIITAVILVSASFVLLAFVFRFER